MRRALWALIAVGLLGSSALSASAFNYATASRSVTVAIVGDAAAYLSLAASGGAYDCFVDTDNGKMALNFGVASECGSGTGTGINAGDGSTSAKYSRYAFHDLVKVTNKAPHALHLWINATTTSGGSSELVVALKPAVNQMANADYSAAESLTSAQFGVGTVAALGVRVKTGTLSSGAVTGTILVEARR